MENIIESHAKSILISILDTLNLKSVLHQIRSYSYQGFKWAIPPATSYPIRKVLLQILGPCNVAYRAYSKDWMPAAKIGQMNGPIQSLQHVRPMGNSIKDRVPAQPHPEITLPAVCHIKLTAKIGCLHSHMLSLQKKTGCLFGNTQSLE